MLQKLEKTLFFIFLILIPFQIRMFLVNSPKSLSAIGLSEWNSIFVYLGDVVLAGVICLWILRGGLKEIVRGKTSDKRSYLLLLIFLIIAFISIFISSATKISVFRWVKLVEFVILFVYIRTLFGPKVPEALGPRTNILKILVLGGVFQAILAIAQFIKQGSVGIKFIEAGIFDPNSPGVANFMLNGEKIMRSYGSFTHPNVLAGFLLLCIFCLYEIYIRRSNPPTSPKLWRDRPLPFLFSAVCFLLLIFGLFLTFSRATILIFLFGSLMMFLFEFFKLRRLEHTEQRLKDGKDLIKLFVLVIVSCLLVIVVLSPYIKARFFTTSLQEQAIDLRFFYNKMALSTIKERPVLGIGIGNFVNYSHNYPVFLRAGLKLLRSSTPIAEGDLGPNQLPDWIFQPVHNIYLLIASEMGILGLLVFLIFIIFDIRRWNLRWEVPPLTILFFCFLIIALSDHYFWTLQSGGIIFWLALAPIKE
ncbi:MAG: O-antigen ligase family protein [Patescibacteria group bacterium]